MVMLDTDQLQDTANLPEGIDKPEPSLTTRQLEEIRDEWLRPLLMQLRHQSEEVGRLEMQVRQLRDERDSLMIERAELRDQLAERPEAANDDSEPESEVAPKFSLESLTTLAAQLQTTEGAAVVGIVIALGLWMGVGLLTWIALG